MSTFLQSKLNTNNRLTTTTTLLPYSNLVDFVGVSEDVVVVVVVVVILLFTVVIYCRIFLAQAWRGFQGLTY